MTVEPKEGLNREKIKPLQEEPPPILKSWKNLYILVFGNLLLWIILFSIFTWAFK